MHRYSILLLCLINCFHAEAQRKKPWKTDFYAGLYTSPVNGDELNDILATNGLPELKWSPVGISQFFITEKDRWNILYSVDLTGRLNDVDEYGNATVNADLLFGFGYSLIDERKVKVVTIAGAKYFFKGYWITCKGENTDFNQLFANECIDYNFFSQQLAANIGFQVFLKDRFGKKRRMSLAGDYSVVSLRPDFFRANSELSQSPSVRNPFSVRVGVRLGQP